MEENDINNFSLSLSKHSVVVHESLEDNNKSDKDFSIDPKQASSMDSILFLEHEYKNYLSNSSLDKLTVLSGKSNISNNKSYHTSKINCSDKNLNVNSLIENLNPNYNHKKYSNSLVFQKDSSFNEKIDEKFYYSSGVQNNLVEDYLSKEKSTLNNLFVLDEGQTEEIKEENCFENFPQSIIKPSFSTKINVKKNILKDNNTEKLKKYKKIEKIGRGNFGEVYLYMHGDKKVAVKRYFSANCNNEKFKERLNLQINLLKELKHSSLPYLYEYHIKEGNYLIFQEYFPITLEKIISLWESNFKIYNEKTLSFKSIAFQLIDAIAFLHDNNVIHRDLKPSNIMISENGELKLIDFDLITKINLNNELSTDVGTLYYRAPEIILGNSNYGFNADLWSLGCILAELYLKYPIFKEENEVKVIESIIKNIGEIDQKLIPNLTELAKITQSNFIINFINNKKETDFEFDRLFSNCYEPFKHLIKYFFQLDQNFEKKAKNSLQLDYFKDFNYEMAKLELKNSNFELISFIETKKKNEIKKI